MKIIGTERDYQRYIIDYLIDNNGYIERKCKTNYDRTTAMDRELLFRFLDTTQPDTMAALRKIYNGQTEETIVKFILQSIDNKGSSLIETLKSGIEISNMHLDLLYGKPATDYNIDLVAKYNANIFSIMEEVWINDDQRIDLVVFLNGFAIATFELKCQNAGQNYRMAIKQYSEDRDPKNRLFLFKAGALVNFAMDLDTCYMTTKLDGLGTRFIPFNRGRGEGVNTGEGNPLDDGVDDYPMHYMWDDILRRDSLIELITKFVFIQREQVVDELTGKKSVKEKLIFPRYHQRDAVRQLLADAEYNGTQLNYLIEHSAGSGKTNTIAWLAHRLVSLHDTQNHIVYDSVLVITDRVVVDRQLQDAIKGIDHKVFVVFGVFVLLRIPLNGNFIAALLTILGYSINDTVVIYDRIRENSALYGKKKMSLAELVNLSVNQSFARSLMTSITTCLALGVVCVVSVIYRLDSIYSFAFPLLFGMVSGVYSTICIATPLWVDWKNKKKAAKKA